jgi:PAS domain S-box-containing protein
LEASREHYVGLFDAAPIGYLEVDRNGLVRNANLTAGSILGLDRQKLLGHALLNLV